MNVIKRKIYTLFHTPRIFMKKFAESRFFHYLPDKLALKIQYKNIFLKDLDLENPKTFNEKLQWLKLYNRRPEYTLMVDKYQVKKYVASVIGAEYIIPTYGIWEDFDEIDFDLLPDQFVLKCTHGSGDTVMVKDKDGFIKANAREKLTKSLKTDYYKIGREWPYKHVPHRIIAEKYIANDPQGELVDYKIMCFNGEPKLIQVHQGRFTAHTQDFYDVAWHKKSIEQECVQSSSAIESPKRLEKMLQLSQKLAADIPHVRVDWYDVNEQLYFGELTFFDGGGFTAFTDEKWDYEIGGWLKLPSKQQ